MLKATLSALAIMTAATAAHANRLEIRYQCGVSNTSNLGYLALPEKPAHFDHTVVGASGKCEVELDGQFLLTMGRNHYSGRIKAAPVEFELPTTGGCRPWEWSESLSKRLVFSGEGESISTSYPMTIEIVMTDATTGKYVSGKFEGADGVCHFKVLD